MQQKIEIIFKRKNIFTIGLTGKKELKYCMRKVARERVHRRIYFQEVYSEKEKLKYFNFQMEKHMCPIPIGLTWGELKYCTGRVDRERVYFKYVYTEKN